MRFEQSEKQKRAAMGSTMGEREEVDVLELNMA